MKILFVVSSSDLGYWLAELTLSDYAIAFTHLLSESNPLLTI
jgi:hypothetical protein